MNFEILTEPFMVRAFLAALCLSPLCAFLGVFVTARRMAFFSDTISHAALAGIALGFWWGLQEPTLPLIGFSLLVAGLLLWLKEHTDLMTETLLALLLSGTVALGILILSLMPERRGDLHRYLFGDILAVNWNEVWLALAALVVGMVWLFWSLNRITLITAHQEMAHVTGIGVRGLNYIFVIVLTLTVALSIRLLGIILVTSLLVIPAAAGRNLAGSLRQHIVWSVILGLVSGMFGTLATSLWNVPTGPAIVLTGIACFGLSLVVRAVRRRNSAHVA